MIEIESVKNQIINEVGLGDVSEQVAREAAKEMKLMKTSLYFDYLINS